MIHSLLNLLYPPYCVVCGEIFHRKPFCPLCWEFCELVNPQVRCPHCFEEGEGLCRRCVRRPCLPFPQAFLWDASPSSLYLYRRYPDLMSSFLIYQFSRLGWDTPDIITPSSGMEAIALELSFALQLPFARNASAIAEDQTILLIDRGSSTADRQRSIRALKDAFPKKGFLLSLFPHDTFDD